jgi:hypothetical protein
VALIKPQLVVPFALLMLLRGYWKFIAGLAVSASVLVIISVLIVGPAVAANYPLMLLHINDQDAAVSVGFLVWAERGKPRLLPFDLHFFDLIARYHPRKFSSSSS